MSLLVVSPRFWTLIPRGTSEICLKGPSVFVDYFAREALLAALLTLDTGNIFNQSGCHDVSSTLKPALVVIPGFETPSK